MCVTCQPLFGLERRKNTTYTFTDKQELECGVIRIGACDMFRFPGTVEGDFLFVQVA